MAFDELELKRIKQGVGLFCRKRTPAHLKDKLRLEDAVKGHDVVIVERRPQWDNESEWTETPVAKLKFIRSANKWRLYWMRADMKWHEYPGLSSRYRLDELVQEVDADLMACFLGRGDFVWSDAAMCDYKTCPCYPNGLEPMRSGENQLVSRCQPLGYSRRVLHIDILGS